MELQSKLESERLPKCIGDSIADKPLINMLHEWTIRVWIDALIALDSVNYAGREGDREGERDSICILKHNTNISLFLV